MVQLERSLGARLDNAAARARYVHARQGEAASFALAAQRAQTFAGFSLSEDIDAVPTSLLGWALLLHHYLHLRAEAGTPGYGNDEPLLKRGVTAEGRKVSPTTVRAALERNGVNVPVDSVYNQLGSEIYEVLCSESQEKQVVPSMLGNADGVERTIGEFLQTDRKSVV